ncbi:hypothetical protein [Virgibacillus proomii]|uniref:hypothetical protein n=1 Tax=Virgibacillus proomii TaxID=84407 RepID=UPI00117D5437|nr:hypothetical protein [Virgibacillus proomii]
MGHIIDISHHQATSSINYDKLAKQVDLAIIRTQYGSNLIDRHYKTHHREFQKRGVMRGLEVFLITIWKLKQQTFIIVQSNSTLHSGF